jgi:4-carboxymuconolactone decarboxylase
MSSPAPERLPPIEPEAMTAEQAAAARAISAGPRGAVRGPFAVLLRSPELMDRVQRLGERIRFGSRLPDALREWAVLVTAAHWRQAYEWSVHAPIALTAGVAPALIDALARGATPVGMSPHEAAIHDFCGQLNARGEVTDETYAAALALFGETGVVELTTLCGYYVMLAMVLNVARTPPEAGVEIPF